MFPDTRCIPSVYQMKLVSYLVERVSLCQPEEQSFRAYARIVLLLIEANEYFWPFTVNISMRL
jgi:hypothetical protein